MKKLLLLLFLIIVISFGCKHTNKQVLKEKQDHIQFDIIKYLGKEKWIEITPKGNTYINYKRCNSENRSIQIIGNHFIENAGQDEANCKLMSINKIDSLKYKIRIEKNCTYGDVFYLNIIDKDKKIIKWDLYYGQSIFTTPNSLIQNYKKVVQPCTDCWSKEECDEMERQEKLKNK